MTHRLGLVLIALLVCLLAPGPFARAAEQQIGATHQRGEDGCRTHQEPGHDRTDSDDDDDDWDDHDEDDRDHDHDRDDDDDVDWDIDRRVLDDEAVSKRTAKRVALRGRTLKIRSTVSEMIVQSGDDDMVRVAADVEFWSDDESWVEEVDRRFDIEVTESESHILIEVELPRPPKTGSFKRWAGDPVVHYEIHLTVIVPPETNLDIENSFGDVAIAGIEGPVKVHNNSGGIIVEEAVGPVTLEGRYGDIRVAEIEGSLQVVTTSGTVAVSGVSGTTKVTNSYGDVGVRDTEGSVELSTTSGSLSVADIGGACTLTTSYGEVAARDIGGPLTADISSGNATVFDVHGAVQIESSYGDVKLRDVEGKATLSVGSGSVEADDIEGSLSVEASHGSIRAADIQGSLTVDAKSTNIEARDIGGAVNVTTSFAGVYLAGVEGAIRVENQSGSVTIEDLDGRALSAEHFIETTFGDIIFLWPSTEGLSFRLESTHGSIRTPFDLEVDEQGSKKILEGSTGRGGGSLTAVTKSGSIRIRED